MQIVPGRDAPQTFDSVVEAFHAVEEMATPPQEDKVLVGVCNHRSELAVVSELGPQQVQALTRSMAALGFGLLVPGDTGQMHGCDFLFGSSKTAAPPPDESHAPGKRSGEGSDSLLQHLDRDQLRKMARIPDPLPPDPEDC